jgi:hypothetical protein
MGYWDKQLKEEGLDPKTLTKEQKEIILEPLDAPENYWQDGELNATEAHQWWCEQMKRTGLSREQISKAIKFNK